MFLLQTVSLLSLQDEFTDVHKSEVCLTTIKIGDWEIMEVKVGETRADCFGIRWIQIVSTNRLQLSVF